MGSVSPSKSKDLTVTVPGLHHAISGLTPHRHSALSLPINPASVVSMQSAANQSHLFLGSDSPERQQNANSRDHSVGLGNQRSLVTNKMNSPTKDSLINNLNN